jgi:hypothetical protein
MNARTVVTGLILVGVLSGSTARAADEPPTASDAIGSDSPWRLAERVEIETVLSWVPVGFSLLTHAERQYVAYYDAKHQMTVTVRKLGERQWQTIKLPSQIGWDAHNYVTMAMDGNGDLHVSGNMHCVPLVYFRTGTPGDVATLAPMPMIGKNEDRCTYPVFLNDAKERLVFHYRDGRSGNGRELFNVYDPQLRTWSRLMESPLFDGEGKRNAYAGGPLLGPDRRFHAFWVWRDTGDCATNNNLSYARSPDLVHWETAAGEPVELPLKLGTKGLIVDPIPSGGGIINGGERLCFDSQRRPMLVYHKSDSQGNMQLYAARFAEGRWTARVLTAWDKPVKFSGFGCMPFIGIALSEPVRVNGDLWSVGYRHRDYGNGTIAFSETTLQPVALELPRRARDLPADAERSEIQFDGVGVRHANDLGDSGSPNVRYVLTWETLPPPSMLRINKLVRNGI